MITEDFRPTSWLSLKGQPLVKSMLQAILRNPADSPRTLIFEGSFGTGKTSTARIFARALNCSGSVQHRPCGSCATCKSDLHGSMFYTEYDSSMMGTVDQVRQIRDSLSYQVSTLTRVIVFDEAHLLSRQAQNALLKEIEEVREGIFFVFCTTTIDDLIPTIRSRSLEVRFENIPSGEVEESLREIASSLQLVVPDSVIQLIISRSNGHMRDAHKLLNQFSVMGNDTFVRVYFNTDVLWMHLFYALLTKKESIFCTILDRLGEFPLLYLKQDYERCITTFLEDTVKQTLTDQEKAIMSLLHKQYTAFFRQLLSSFVLDSFESDFRLRSAFLLLYDQYNSR